MAIKCSFKSDASQSSDILFVDDTSILNKVTVVGPFGTRIANSYMSGNVLSVLESESRGGISTLIFLDPSIDIAAIRSTIGTAPGQLQIATSSMRGECRMQR